MSSSTTSNTSSSITAPFDPVATQILQKSCDECCQSLPLSVVAPRVTSAFMFRSLGKSRPPSPKANDGNDSEASSIERIEQRTKASIDKLKHILCTVKTRPGDASLFSLISKHAGNELPAPHHSKARRRLQRLKDLGLLEDGPNETGSFRTEECGGAEEVELPVSEAFVQHDALTSTKTVVKVDKDTRATTVTIIALVKDPAGKALEEEPLAKSIVLAARALGRSAAALEEKSHSFTDSSKYDCNFSEGVATTDKAALEHDRLVLHLEKSRIVEGTQVRKGHYAGTPFRPVYKVKLEHPNGSTLEALVKPATPGDVHCHWGNASSDWVAYQVGRLLGTDMVPPSAMRKDVKVGEKTFPLATLIYFVPNVKPLTRLSLQEWGGDLPAVFVSNAHILDALLGSCPRARNMFMEGSSWTDPGAKQAMLLDHPMSPGQGKLHPMWTQRGQIGGIKCVSGNTLTRLRSLNKDAFSTALGKWVTTAEIDNILERLQQVISYFDVTALHGNRSLTIV